VQCYIWSGLGNGRLCNPAPPRFLALNLTWFVHKGYLPAANIMYRATFLKKVTIQSVSFTYLDTEPERSWPSEFVLGTNRYFYFKFPWFNYSYVILIAFIFLFYFSHNKTKKGTLQVIMLPSGCLLMCKRQQVVSHTQTLLWCQFFPIGNQPPTLLPGWLLPHWVPIATTPCLAMAQACWDLLNWKTIKRIPSQQCTYQTMWGHPSFNLHK